MVAKTIAKNLLFIHRPIDYLLNVFASLRRHGPALATPFHVHRRRADGLR